MDKNKTIKASLASIFKAIRNLQCAFAGRREFTIDGRLVGDIGEIVAELHYSIILDEVSQPGHDATTEDGRRVQIKATFKDKLSLSSIPEVYLGIKLNEDGTFEEIYNGPGHIIAQRFASRKGIGKTPLSLSVSQLRLLNNSVPLEERVNLRL